MDEQTKHLTFEFIAVNGRPLPPAPIPVVADLLNAGEVSMLVGSSNVGKTAIAVRMGADIARGRPVAGRPTSRGAVVHMAAEGMQGVHERVHPHLAAIDSGDDYLLCGQRLDMRKPEQIGTLIECLESALKQPLRLLIIDTAVLSLGEGDENLPRDVTEAVEGAKRIAVEFGCHVMIVHHLGKDADRGSRGSSAWQTNVDTELVAREKDGVVTVAQTKQRNMKRGPSLHFHLEETVLEEAPQGRKRSTVVASYTTPASGASREPEKTGVLSLAAEAALAARANLGADPIATEALRLMLSPSAFQSSGDDAQRKALSRVLDSLAKGGRVVKAKAGATNVWRLVKTSHVQAA